MIPCLAIHYHKQPHLWVLLGHLKHKLLQQPPGPLAHRVYCLPLHVAALAGNQMVEHLFGWAFKMEQ